MGDYDIGYAKPPKHSQFQKGKSGNFEEHSNESIYPSDVSEALNLDYDLVMHVIELLENEGRIAKTEA